MSNNILLNFKKVITRKNILLFFLYIISILFMESIQDYYNQKVVDGILSKIKSSRLIDLTVIVVTIVTLLITINLWYNKRRITNHLLIFGIFLFILFIYCRLYSNNYSFESYYWFPKLKYIDYIFIPFAALFLIKTFDWINKRNEPAYKNSPFLLDKPIKESRHDKFGRQTFAKKIAEKIQSKLKVEEAGALAIV